MYLEWKQRKCKTTFEYQRFSVFLNERGKKAGDKKRQGREEEKNGFML